MKTVVIFFCAFLAISLMTANFGKGLEDLGGVNENVSSTYVDDSEEEGRTELVSKESRLRKLLTKSTVKITEDVVVKDIYGVIREFKKVSSGSGVVIATSKKKNQSLIMTASHVCRARYKKGKAIKGDTYLVISTKKRIITLDGESMPAKIIHDDKDNDTCVMVIDGIAGRVARIARKQAPIGARIYTVGAPTGIWDKGVANIVEGFFVGIKDKDICVGPVLCFKHFIQFSFPTIGGMSGSAIYYEGKIIGLVTLRSTRYDHAGWGPGLQPVRDAHEEAIRKWLAEPVEKPKKEAPKN